MTKTHKKTKFNIGFVWFMEFFIWFLLLVVLSSVIMLGKYYYKNSFNSYQIFMQDVDGLIAGSPVKMMGVQVGYVRHVEIVNGLVFVDFVITKKNLKIPKGSMVIPEFNGLGGSKSLEIYTNKYNNPNSPSYLIIKNPRRIHDVFGLLDVIFQKISDISCKISNFNNELNLIKPVDIVVETKSIEEKNVRILDNTNKWIDTAQKKVEKIDKKIKRKGMKNE